MSTPQNTGSSYLSMLLQDSVVQSYENEEASRRLVKDLYEKGLITTAAFNAIEQHPPLRHAMLAAHNAGRKAERDTRNTLTYERNPEDRFAALDL